MIERSAPPASAAKVTVLIAEPEMLVRAGLHAVLDGDPPFQVAGEAVTGRHALELVERLSPALAIVSTGLRDPDGIEVTRRVRELSPATAIVLLARFDDSHSLIAGLRAGATGFVRSDVGRLELLTALRRALAGECTMDPNAAAELIMRMAAESDIVPFSMPDPLTPREVQILHLVAQGHTNRQIATRLIVAVGTIKVHIEHILGKLGATDRTQAAVRAVELGIVRAEDREGSVASTN